MTTPTLTPTRVAALQLLARHPGGYFATGVTYEVAPRPGSAYGWTAQGAARMSGRILKAMERAGWVRVDRDRMAHITEAGRKVLDNAVK
jgi:ribosomal protein S19E (S16A)